MERTDLGWSHHLLPEVNKVLGKWKRREVLVELGTKKMRFKNRKILKMMITLENNVLSTLSPVLLIKGTR